MLPMLAFSFHDLDTGLNEWAHALQWPVEPLLRLFLAALLGGLVGFEREIRGRQAGFRTNLLVATGCALTMIVSVSFAFAPWPRAAGFNINVDPARVAYGVMAGIGFLGAGVIVKHGGTVRGLTTAAGLWCVAAIGLACGQGLYLVATFATILVLMVLWFLAKLEKVLPKTHFRTVTIRRPWQEGVIRQTVEMVEKEENREVRDTSFQRLGDLSTVEIRLEVAFSDKEQYYKFEDQINRHGECQLISATTEQ